MIADSIFYGWIFPESLRLPRFNTVITTILFKGGISILLDAYSVIKMLHEYFFFVPIPIDQMNYKR